jgi:hypothetical protein
MLERAHPRGIEAVHRKCDVELSVLCGEDDWAVAAELR